MQRDHQLSFGHRPYRQTRSIPIFVDRATERDGRARSRRPVQFPGRAYGTGRPRACAAGRPLLEQQASGRPTRLQGRRAIRCGGGRQSQGGLDYGDQSGRQPAQRGFRQTSAARLRNGRGFGLYCRHRHRSAGQRKVSRYRVERKGRHRDQLRAAYFKATSAFSAERRSATGLVDHMRGCQTYGI